MFKDFKPNLKKILFVFVIIVLLVFSFLGGTYLGAKKGPIIVLDKLINKDKTPSSLSQDIDFSMFWDVWNLVKSKYVKQPVSESQLFYGAMTGLIDSLDDPYSIFLDPQTAQKFTQELSGEFEGIGSEIGVRKGLLTVISSLPNTPAEKAGLKSKDNIFAINGVETKGMSLDYAVSQIRGKKGTSVRLSVMRDGFVKPRDFVVPRDTINIISVNWEMKKDNLAYLKVSHFNGDTESDFRKAVNEIIIKKPKGIILDLRSNPGGFLKTAIDVASYWVEKGVIVKEKLVGDQKIEHSAEGNAVLKDYPTVVLVNGGSASSSEIVAGALQDYKKATILGEKTFGKGSVQELDFLKDSSAVKLTIAKWFTPNDHQIDETGIAPDVEVKMTDSDYDAGKDPQLDKAMELLNQP